MHIDHAATLLKYCAADDSRTISALDIQWWADNLADIELPQAIEGLKRFRRARPDARVTVWHVITEVRTLRAEAIQHGSRIDELVPNVNPDDVTTFRDEIRAIRSAAGSNVLDVDSYQQSGETLSGAPAVKAIGAAGAVVDAASFRKMFPRKRSRDAERELNETHRKALERKRADELAALAAKYDLTSA